MSRVDTSGFGLAIAELRETAERIAHPDRAFAAAAELCADATRRQIEARGLVASGELRDSVYARGSEFGVAVDHASFVEERRPFVPVRSDGETTVLVEPLGTQVRELLETYAEGEGR